MLKRERLELRKRRALLFAEELASVHRIQRTMQCASNGAVKSGMGDFGKATAIHGQPTKPGSKLFRGRSHAPAIPPRDWPSFTRYPLAPRYDK